jgi:hypothetical protein
VPQSAPSEPPLALAVLRPFDDARVFELDQFFLLHRSRLVQHFVRGVDAVEAQHNQRAHRSASWLMLSVAATFVQRPEPRYR